MKTYTYSEARERLAALLDRARREGRVQIRRRNGQVFLLLPAKSERSPLDVPGVRARLPRGELLTWLRDSPEDSATRLLDRGSSDERVRRARANSNSKPRRRAPRRRVSRRA
ncbi:MAG: type II toxin-antitoxin system Phd/YefM family antitoxin [Candidatus Coatesbacteria bacterium]|nr:type II toxin-antitoxin system Phd/YefM family antitoxin [Candidatus Coatesbacteria bacterium]